MQIKYLKVFDTNYIWILQSGQDIIVVDPGSFEVVSNYITANKLNLTAILLTHSHWDHVSGVNGIVKEYNIPVYASENLEQTDDLDRTNIVFVKDNEAINILPDITIKALSTPGHTMDGVSYLVRRSGLEYLFCGDTLFAGGCGRVFTRDYLLMLSSLDRIRNLNEEILVYPGHEYTLGNLDFAKFIEPDNENIAARIKLEEMSINGVTLPTTIAKERLTNPFLRIDELKHVIEQRIAGKELENRVDVFKVLRDLKDDFS